MMLVTPVCPKRGLVLAMSRRYFEETFREGEAIELYFIGARCCYLRVVKILPATKPDGSPASIYLEHRERYEIMPGAGQVVMEVPS